ncbi:calcium-binding protein [Ralstonia solanacearum]|uniref:calcium-binding protein n=1 Tax=Ralstonia solanacearum TaxID=305 RepID=UPI0012FDBC65|nr:calcium-binding protein [Ralstonia solanacearum]
MINLTPGQRAVVDKIIISGMQMGVSAEVIEAAVNIANAESSFNPIAQNSSTSAYGLFQYINGTWSAAWSSFQSKNPDDPLASLSSSNARSNVDAQIKVMYADLQKWNAGYDEGQIAVNYMPGGSLYGVTQQLATAGIDINHDFLEYAYLRHNTDPNQVISITNSAFTAINMSVVKDLVSAAIKTAAFMSPISDLVNSYFRRSLFNSGSDPLAIDLTGGGIKTIGASQSGVMFDTTGSGNTVSTGWIAEGTGWLVYAPSGATTLTSETQLFGAASLLPNGEYATDGFQALSLLDSNGDGVIDAKDPEFANLRVWAGAPSSGSSDPNMSAGQMLTLQQLGIVSISLDEQPCWNNTGGTGVEVNTESSYATVTWSDGHQTTIGAVNLTSDPFYQDLAPPTQLQTSSDSTVNAVPLMWGSGAVYDTRTAAQLSPSFGDLLKTYSALTSRADQIAMLPQLLSAWGGTSNFQALMERNRWGESSPCYVYQFDGIQQSANNNGQLNPGDPSNWTDAYREMIGIVDVLEKFNGQLLYDPASTGTLWGHNRAFINYTPGSGSGDGSSGSIFVSPIYSIQVTQSQVNALMQGYQALERSIYQGLVLQTRLMPYLSAMGLSVGSTGIGAGFDFGALNNLLDGKLSTDPVNAMVDLVELTASGSGVLSAVGYDPTTRLRQWAMQLQGSGQWQNFLAQFNDGLEANYGNGIFNVLSYAGNDIFVTGGSNVNVRDENGNSILVATAGNDTLISGKGNDTLVAGIGYTYMAGRSGADTYVFERGDGIAEMETSGGQNNVLQLTNYNRSDLVLRQDGDTMVLDFGNGDAVRLHDYFLRQRVWAGDVGMRSVQFADGTQMSIAQLAASANTVHGNGDGTFSGGWGNNILIGGVGNETLVGGNGDSTLVAGVGNDMLQAGSGNNTYVYAQGDGAAAIDSSRVQSSSQNVLQLTGYNQSNLQALRQDGNNLILDFGGGDTVKLTDFFLHAQNNAGRSDLSSVLFADGTQATMASLMSTLGLHLANGNQTFRLPLSTPVKIYGGTGNETIQGGTNNSADTIVAGVGYSYITGFAGAATYVFERGDGIAEMETSGGQNNVLQLTNYNRSDLVLRQDGDTMVLDFGNGDAVRLHDYFLRQRVWAGDVGMRSVQFADGTQMSIAQLAASANTVHGNGDGTFSGGWGNNILIGGVGNETLVGGNGNSTLVAGVGNDTMVGSASGSNLYEIQASAANNTIVNRTGSTANSSTLQFDGANSDQLWFQHVGNDLLVSVIGTSTQVSISGWYTATSNHVQQITAADGKTLADGQVDALVQAMASFSPPSAGTTTLPLDYQAQLQPTLAANWR